MANFRWNHLFSNQLFSNLSLIYSDYDYKLDFSFADFVLNSSIVNLNLEYDFKHYLTDKIKLEYGLNSIYYKFDPGLIKTTKEESQIQMNKVTDRQIYTNPRFSLLGYSRKFSLWQGWWFSDETWYDNFLPYDTAGHMNWFKQQNMSQTWKITGFLSNLSDSMIMTYYIITLKA